MSTDAVVAAFRRLHTPDQRQDAIRALVAELSPYEWRSLHYITSARSFHFDIIAQLPVELVAHVFAHLDTSAPFRLQRVSRTWRQILQSSDVLRLSLNNWYNGSADLQGLGYDDLVCTAKSIHAFRRGLKPNSSFKINTHHPHGHEIILVEHTLIWTHMPSSDQLPRMIYLFNIKTWSLYTLNGEAREAIDRVFASDQIAGFVTRNNTCYVSSLEGRKRKKFKLPNANTLQAISCRERTVACAGCLDNHILVFIWNYDSQQGRHVTISYDANPYAYSPRLCKHTHGLALLLQPKQDRFVLFIDEHCIVNCQYYQKSPSSPFACVRYSRFTYSGNHIDTSRTELSHDSPSVFYRWQNEFVPVDRCGVFRLTPVPGTQHQCAQFDETLNDFTSPGHSTKNAYLWVDMSVYWWKDTFFSAANEPLHITGIEPFLVHKGTSFQETILLRDDNGRRSRMKGILLNDRYVIRPTWSSFHILCYDGTLQLPNESGPFFDIGSVEAEDPALAV